MSIGVHPLIRTASSLVYANSNLLQACLKAKMAYATVANWMEGVKPGLGMFDEFIQALGYRLTMIPTGGPPLVSVESPYAGDIIANKVYAKLCMKDSISRGESPFLSHLYFPEVLDDLDPTEREQGLTLSDEWRKRCDKLAVYIDRGISSGMHRAMALARAHNIPIEERQIVGIQESAGEVPFSLAG